MLSVRKFWKIISFLVEKYVYSSFVLFLMVLQKVFFLKYMLKLNFLHTTITGSWKFRKLIKSILAPLKKEQSLLKIVEPFRANLKTDWKQNT